MGSIITIAVRLVIPFFKLLKSPYFKNLTPGSRGSKGAALPGCPVIDSAPIVLPWKLFVKATILDFPVRREALIAASFASAPELQKNILAESSPTSSFNFLASSSTCGCAYKLLTCERVLI